MERYTVANVVIRPARDADAEAIGGLWAELVQHHHALDAALPAAATDGPVRYARAIQDHLRGASTLVLVADCDGEVVGYALGVVADMISSLFAHEATGFIADLYVCPNFQRRGVGRRLVSEMATWFAAQGVEHYEWHVAVRNQEALAFWRAMGGEPLMMRMRGEIT